MSVLRVEHVEWARPPSCSLHDFNQPPLPGRFCGHEMVNLEQPSAGNRPSDTGQDVFVHALPALEAKVDVIAIGTTKDPWHGAACAGHDELDQIVLA
nr:hypothetical protein [Alkalilimnicola ehrlichii]